MPTRISLRLTSAVVAVAIAAVCVGVNAQSSVAPLSPSLPAIQLIENRDFSRHFEEAGASGTFVLFDPCDGRYLVHNPERAARRFIPASTFKILNSLIALETGAIADTSTVLGWDGQIRQIEPWNRDHSMTTAISNSVVWFYQELARRIGEERMQKYVQDSGYGNGAIGGGIDSFWLDGDLRISALEQIDFLVRLYDSDLPFSESTMNAVKDIMIEDRSDDGDAGADGADGGDERNGTEFVLRAKSGWGNWDPVDVGW